jgi:ribosomal protein S27AE
MPFYPPAIMLNVIRPRPNEQFQRVWRCSGYVWSDDDDESSGGWSKGCLVGSDQRLAFLQDARTLTMKKSFVLQESIELASITNVSAGGRGAKDLVVDWMGKNRPVQTIYRSLTEASPETLQEIGPADVPRVASEIVTLKLRGPHIFVSSQSLNPAERPRYSPLPVAPAPEPAPARIDYPSLSNLLARNGVSTKDLRCIHCGQPFFFPTQGESIYCGHCGTQVKAADLLVAMRPYLKNP